MKQEFKSLDEQLYELLVGTNDTYAQIGSKIGISAATVSKKTKEAIDKFGLNPSLARTGASKKTKMYAKYCYELKCHKLFYVSAAQAKTQQNFYCSKRCQQGYNALPIKQDLVAAYNRMSFMEMADAYDISYGVLARLFEQYNINPTEFPENVLVVPAYIMQRRTEKVNRVRRPVSGISRSGYREHLGFLVRSSWENNFCLYLNHKGIKFDYEPLTFTFPEDRGVRAYVPDFRMYIDGKEVWSECKGRYLSKDGTKMRRMRQYYPEVFENMTYVVEKPGCKADIAYKKLGLQPFAYYNDLVKEYSSKLKHWEG